MCRSTAIEVALKMAFRKFLADRPELLADMQAAEESGSQSPALGVLGLANAYHGDTLGTMDAVAPSPYNGLQQTPWYIPPPPPPPPPRGAASPNSASQLCLVPEAETELCVVASGLYLTRPRWISFQLTPTMAWIQRAPIAGHAPPSPSLQQSLHFTPLYHPACRTDM